MPLICRACTLLHTLLCTLSHCLSDCRFPCTCGSGSRLSARSRLQEPVPTHKQVTSPSLATSPLMCWSTRAHTLKTKTSLSQQHTYKPLDQTAVSQTSMLEPTMWSAMLKIWWCFCTSFGVRMIPRRAQIVWLHSWQPFTPARLQACKLTSPQQVRFGQKCTPRCFAACIIAMHDPNSIGRCGALLGGS